LKNLLALLCALLFNTAMFTTAALGSETVVFQARTASSGKWSDAETWVERRQPQAGDFVQVRTGHTVTYDVHSDTALRMVHIAGTLTFSREKSTLMDVGLIKIESGETTTEDGFDCHEADHASPSVGSLAVLEMGTPESPIPAGVNATIRLRHFKGTNSETLPAILACGGRWDVHGASMKRTWLKLARPAKVGDSQVAIEQPTTDWRVGDRIIITTSVLGGPETGSSFRKTGGRPKPVGTEERIITGIGDSTLSLDRPLNKVHCAEGQMRCEVANLSRNIVIESTDPSGVRGHTMYHHGSSGGISYAEFRHLGKDGVLGKYAIHFHLVRDTMRGSGVMGASIWDSHNRWITIHGTDHLLIRDCVGYQSRGHGFFLEDATEQWNVIDRNLAVQAFTSVGLPKQVLPFDPNDGAGFWWANGRNTFTRNVSCENDRYGYHFQIAKSPDFDPNLHLCGSDGTTALSDVRTIPFFRFEDNESHGDGLFSFRFGDEEHGTVHGDRQHPFIARNLRAWESHYVIRPNVQFFLLDGLKVKNAAYGIYHPDYDSHVYRDLEFHSVNSEPLNGGHDERSLPFGNFTYDRLTFENCRMGRDPLIQLTRNGSIPDLAGHFRSITVRNCETNSSSVVDFGGGPRSNRIDTPVNYYFHDTPLPSTTTHVASVKIPSVANDATYESIQGWSGPEVRAATIKELPFPDLLDPVDDVPPATLVTNIELSGMTKIVRGVSHDNGEVRSVRVNGLPARITSQHAGIADWVITLESPADKQLIAQATDSQGNIELTPHSIECQCSSQPVQF